MCFNLKCSGLMLLRLVSCCIIGIALTGSSVSAQPGPTPVPTCYKTENVGKCGTDRDENPINCGGSTCYLLSFVYGNLYNCLSAGSGGLKTCAAGQCKETVITRTCEPNGMCRVAGQETHDQIPTSFASGPACSSSGPVEPQ